MTNQAHRTAKLAIGDKSLELPIYQGTIGPDVIDIRRLYSDGGVFTFDPGYTSTGSCESAITYIDGDKGELLYRGYPDRAAGREVELPRGRLPAALRRAADGGAARGLREPGDQPHHAARADGVLLPRLPARRAPDGDGLRHHGRDVGLLPQLDRHHRRLAARGGDDPDDRQDADDRRLGVQVLGRPALRLSEEQPRLRLELPQHVLRGAGRGLRGRPDPQPRDGPDLHAPRRPRAERLDLDGAARLLLGRQSLRLHRGGRRLPLGAGAWRRERGVPPDAARDRHAGPHPGVHRAAPRTRTTRSG